MSKLTEIFVEDLSQLCERIIGAMDQIISGISSGFSVFSSNSAVVKFATHSSRSVKQLLVEH